MPEDLNIQNWIERRLKQVKASGEANGDTDRPEANDYAPQFLRRVVEAAAQDFKEILDAEIKIATIRYAHRPKQIGRLHLRPIWCNSPGLYNIFAKNEILRFIERDRPDTPMFSPDLGQNLLGTTCDEIGVFSLQTAIDASCEIQPADAVFTLSRIQNFLDICDRGESAPEVRTATQTLKSTPGSFVLIAAQSGARNDGVQLLVALYGVTRKHGSREPIGFCESAREQVSARMARLKGDIDRITTLDSGLFRAEGLALAAKLLPAYKDDRICAADKLSLLIEHVKKLLTRHLIGIDFTQEDLSRGRPEIHFIRVKFQRTHAYNYRAASLELVYHPVLDIYPAIYSEQGRALANFLVAHPGVPSWTKYALIRYFRSTLVIDPTEFSLSRIEAETVRANLLATRRISLTDIFSSRRAFPLAVRDRDQLRELERKIESLNKCFDGAKKADQFVFARSLAPELWDEINVPTSAGVEEARTKSIAVFIVEGLEHTFNVYSEDANKKEGHNARDLPLGMIVFESTYDDVYSDKDIDDLREICIGFSHLIRLTRHRNACFNFDEKLKDRVFESNVALDSPPIRFRDYQYQVNRLDAEAFHAIFSSDENRGIIARALLNYNVALATSADGSEAQQGAAATIATRRKLIAEFFEQHKEIFEAHRFDEAINNEADILVARRSKFSKARPALLRSYETWNRTIGHPGSANAHPNWALEMLTAVPSNFTWESYRECLAGAFAERARLEDPDFSRMNPGFSADQILMAAFGSELSQVVKLSSAQKLTRERDRYQLYVRYRITAAARIPSYALTIDSRGVKGRDSGLAGRWTAAVDREGFGSLISDLIASPSGNGADAPPTLADYFAKFAAQSEQTVTEDLCAKICTEIPRHFFEARNNWRRLRESEIDSALKGLGASGVKTPRELISYSMITKSDASGDYVKFRDVMIKADRDPQGNRWGDNEKNSIAQIIKLAIDEYDRMHDRSPRWDIGAVESYLDRTSFREVSAASLDQPFVTADLAASSAGRTFGVVHGDLNGANLVWSEGFNGFFLIDFEHCHLSLEGVDQWRLATNLLCNVIINWLRAFDEKTIDGRMSTHGINEQVKNLVSSVVNCAYIIDRLTDVANAPCGQIDESSPRSKMFKDIPAARIIRAILESLVMKSGANSVAWGSVEFDKWFFGGQHDSLPNRAEWHLMACLAAETEFLLVYRDLLRNRALLRLSDRIFEEMGTRKLTGIEAYMNILVHTYARQRMAEDVELSCELSDVRTLSRLVISILLREAALASHIVRPGAARDPAGHIQ